MGAQQSRSPWPGTLAAGAAIVLGAWLLHGGGTGAPPPAPAAGQALSGFAPVSVIPPLGPSAPTRIRIPAVRLDAPVTGLGLDADGHLQAPPVTDRNLAGWYRDGATPGQRGTAIIAGHVDTKTGPAVFYHLGALHRGDRIEFVRADGATAVYQLYAIEVHDRKDFPDDRVYRQADDAQLRVITCGGAYSEEHGYEGNVVAYGFLADTTRPGKAA
ncbi:class F sortase [Kitasatospora aureofaciens]|uniref:class F sortase n=1 Tax=Kitasatospora aureofaciens TaxID=1894 RepID=UPI0027DF39F4|nr:class F sortase [Kitasatospora aureofaciens]